MFVGLAWEKHIRYLGDPFDPLLEHNVGVVDRYSDD